MGFPYKLEVWGSVCAAAREEGWGRVPASAGFEFLEPREPEWMLIAGRTGDWKPSEPARL